MTSHDLYAIYASAYAEWSHFESGKPPQSLAGLGGRLRRLLSIERAIEELGRHDATDGRPMRSRHEFEGALRQGRQVLTGLGVALEAGT
ncbi:MAG: hypothetical protein WCK73_00970 [Deltaproteobacteria bacterium]